MINVENEYILESNLIKKLEDLGYSKINITNEEELKQNLKKQLENLNFVTLTNGEFENLYREINRGDNFDRASKLRNDKFILRRGSEIKEIKYFNIEKWCENNFQVANQITIKNQKRINRYDVTILVNGFPMIQIELKRKGGELKEAFNQVNRYKRDTYKNLFKFIQIFIISTGNDTKYFSTNDNEGEQQYKFAFKWTDENNKPILNLLLEENGKQSFVDAFLTRCGIAKMIAKYMIIQKGSREIKILRPYQYHAVEKILRTVSDTNRGGYIWHTTGSGKTLTSFKSAQEIKNNVEKIEKVFFVVDRRDLNAQTTREFQNFDSDEDIYNTTSTKDLIKNIKSKKNELIITTIQKFDLALKELNKIDSKENDEIRNKKVVLIFDECHRSTFGDSNKEIKKFFKNHQMIGFTGTPIKDENNINKQTTDELFDNNLLHEYKISEAIADNNVLGFSVEYMKTYNSDKVIVGDEEVEGEPDRKEILEANKRIKIIVENIFKIHDKKTINKEYNAMFAISNIKLLKKYYKEFKKQNEFLEDEKKLNIATIFSINDNDDVDDGETPSRDMYDELVKDLSKIIGKNLNTSENDWFNIYRSNLLKAIKDRKIDIVLVVNMLTTGFDAPKLNTLYVDKKLEYHGLVQAFSRTNRIDQPTKTQGNIVIYSRPNKTIVDKSIALYSTREGLNGVIKGTYEEYISKLNIMYSDMLQKFPNSDYVASLRDEEEKAKFIKFFKEITSKLNIAKTFFNFDYKDLVFDEQEYVNFAEQYKKIWRENSEKPKEFSILNEIDFAIEQLATDKIDTNYIKKLLEDFGISNNKEEKEQKAKKLIDNLYRNSIYNKKLIEVIEKFVNNQLEKINLNSINEKEKTWDNLIDYLNQVKKDKINKIINKYKINDDDFKNIIEIYESGRPLNINFLRNMIKSSNLKDENELKYYGKERWEIISLKLEKLENDIRDIYDSTELI